MVKFLDLISQSFSKNIVMINSSFVQRFVQRTLFVALIAVTAIILVRPLWRLPHRVYIDYNEGWMAYFSDAAIQHHPLYQPLDATILNNYPPLSFYLTGLFGKLIGDTIRAGRILSFAGLFLSAILIAFLIYRFTSKRYLSCIGSLYFLGYMCIYHSDYIGMNDPQWIALGVMLLGFTLFVYKGEQPKFLLISLSIMFVAGLIKNNLVSLPLAASLWLFLNNRKIFFQWIIVGSLLLLVTFVAFISIYGKECLADILLSSRVFSIGSLARVGVWLTPLLLYIVVAMYLFMIDKRPEIQLLFIAAIISLLWGTVAFGGGGIYYNVLFEFIIITFIASFVAVDKLIAVVNLRFSSSEIAKLFILFLPILIRIPYEIYLTKESIRNVPRMEQIIFEDIAFLSSFPDPVMCENLALSYWAGKKYVFDFYSTGQKLKSGRMKKECIAQMLQRKEFSIIQINNEKGNTDLFPENINRYIAQDYTRIRVSEASGVFLRR
jgi:hypothetical protein